MSSIQHTGLSEYPAVRGHNRILFRRWHILEGLESVATQDVASGTHGEEVQELDETQETASQSESHDATKGGCADREKDSY